MQSKQLTQPMIDASVRQSRVAQAVRIPSLDGLRAISIAMVLVGHLVGTRNTFGLGLPRLLGDVGNFGVRVFFVISGFLITSLLLEERAATGTISLPNFYLRRCFRIFPVFYAYISIMALAGALGWAVFRPGDIFHALTYTINYHYDRSWWFGHIWSLSVEEQFYILWPAVILLAGVRKSLFSAAAVIVVSPIIRLGYWYLLPSQRMGIGEAFPTISDALAVGCLLAGIQDRLSGHSGYMEFLQSRRFYVVPVLALLANLVHDRPRIDFLVGQSVMNFCIAVTIDRFVRFPHSLPGHLLNSRPLEFIGVLSYSVYLWQQPFLNRHSDAQISAFPLNVVLVGLAGVASYYTLERPFLGLRRRLEARRSIRPKERS